MATEAFQKNSLSWQLQQGQQRFTEWLEGIFTRVVPDRPMPDWSLPAWLSQGIFWLVVIGLLAWLGWQAYQIASPYLQTMWRGYYDAVALVQPSSSHGLTSRELLRQAQEAQRKQRYRDACRLLYLAVLSQLDERQVIVHQASRTDREYLALLTQQSILEPYQTLFETHERLSFSNFLVSKEVCDRCWQAYREIEQAW
jgi:hypothetical protein